MSNLGPSTWVNKLVDLVGPCDFQPEADVVVKQ